MHSFVPILIIYLDEIQPKKCLEWGPGKSTSVFLNNISNDASLVSIEHNINYFNQAQTNIGYDSRWTLLLNSATKRSSSYAHCIFNYEHNFDLAFVDGRRRVECCFAAMVKLNKNGIIILHDSSRKTYLDILSPYIKIIKNSKDTLVFKPNNSYSNFGV